MTAMPQMVAIFNGMGGATAALVSVAEFIAHRPSSVRGETLVDRARADHRLDLVRRQHDRLRQAAGADLRAADPYPDQQIVNVDRWRRHRGARRAAICLDHDSADQGAALAHLRARAGARRVGRAADRRRRYAGRDRDPQLADRPRGGRSPVSCSTTRR